MLPVSILGLAASLPVQAERTFAWSFETDTPELYPEGSDSTPTYADYGEEPMRIDTVSHDGDYSLNCSSAAWRSATFDNPTNTPTWATPTEGAYSLWWQYSGDFVGGMLMMITGKAQKTAPELDTNEGISVRFKDQKELMLGYGWGKDDTWGSVTARLRLDWGDPMVLQPDNWYFMTAQWQVDENYELTLRLTLQDESSGQLKETTGTFTVGPWVALAFHQVLIGNDRGVSPTGWYIDEVEIFDDFAMTSTVEETEWLGYPISQDRFVDTGDWLGMLYVFEDRHWAYAYETDKFLYFADPEAVDGSWIYVGS